MPDTAPTPASSGGTTIGLLPGRDRHDANPDVVVRAADAGVVVAVDPGDAIARTLVTLGRG